VPSTDTRYRSRSLKCHHVLVAGVRGRLIATVAVVALVAAVAWLAVPLILKPPTGRTQARLAQHDPLWEQQPRELRETSRFVVTADAGWLPWANRVTGVGRYYALNPTDRAREIERWSTAATAAGWLPYRTATCGPMTAVVHKRIARATSVLQIAPDATGEYLLVNITFPVNTGEPPGC